LETQTNRQMNQMSDRDRPSFTPKQGQYLAFIDAYTRVNRRPPAEREMQRHFGVTPPSVHQMILTLERAGFIRRQPGVPRSIEVLVPPEHLPVLQAHIQPVKTSVTRY
jgi:DNA-binding MarR family transcriptional regulator